MQQDKDWCLGIIAIMWILALLCIGIIFVNEIRDKNEEIKRLEEENIDLTISLKQAEGFCILGITNDHMVIRQKTWTRGVDF